VASSTWDSIDGNPIKQSLPTIPESPEGGIPGSERPAPASEIVEKTASNPPVSNTNIQQEVTTSVSSSGAEEPPLLSTTQVSVDSEISQIQGSPTGYTKRNESRDLSGNRGDENLGLAQGFDDAGILQIPSFDEALALWKRLEPRLKERAIGDMLAEHLGMDNAQPNAAQASQLEAWLRHFISIHCIKKLISRLRRDIKTGEGGINEEGVQYERIVYQKREMFTEIGLEGTTGLKGNILLNEYTEHPSNSAPALVYRWTSFIGMDITENVGEVDVESGFGNLIPRLFVGQEWQRYR
jgi:hypothetical protein